MSSPMSAFSMQAVRALPAEARLTATGLVLAAAGMLLQIAAGSTLYPSVTGPIVLLVTAAFVLFGPPRWSGYVGLVVPLVLGVGAIVAAAVTGGFIGQLTDVGRPALLLGSLLHVVGLVAAVAGGLRMVLGRRSAGA